MITPQEAIKLTKADRVEVRALERMIDRALAARFQGGTVYVEVREFQTGRVYDELARMYGSAGWNIQYESNQRDGDFLIFNPIGGQDD